MEKGRTSVRVFAEDHHLPLVALRRQVALKAVLVPTLLLAHLAVPSQLLQPFGLDPVGDLQGTQNRIVSPSVIAGTETTGTGESSNTRCEKARARCASSESIYTDILGIITSHYVN